MSDTITQVIALFGAGVASFLAPCIVPLVPAYLGIIVGEMGDAHDPARAVPATLLFIAGFTTVFAGLGATAGLLGSSLSTFQTGVRVVGGAVIIVMGLALLGVLRGPLSRERLLIPTLPKVRGVIRPYVVGIAFGAGWSPCVGPLLAAALTIAARSGEVGRGTLLLSAYAAGIGVPFLLAALGLASSRTLAARLQRAGPRLERVSGFLLLALGVLLVSDTYQHLTSYLARFVPAVHGL
jgi:cytochrome c-type biogenesis protein